MKINKISVNAVDERLRSPFGFKGASISMLRQTVVTVSSGNETASCPGVQSVLWSDADVFSEYGPAMSDNLMLEVTRRAALMLEDKDIERPDLCLASILPELSEYADRLCGLHVKTTFVLNSLVGLDGALWCLWAKTNGFTTFDEIIPPYARRALSFRNQLLAHIPLLSYGVDRRETKEILGSGTALLKIKIGHKSPDCRSREEDMEKMLEWDKARLLEIHSEADRYRSVLTTDTRIKYYLDANGRYDTLERVGELLSFAREIGAINDIVLLEEPFALDSTLDVSPLGVCVAADESAHSVADVKARLALGYRAIALKPIAKTFSESFGMASAAEESGAECFCADLTVNPLLVEWNKQFAARLRPINGLKCGSIEVNGNQNYADWERMKTMLPAGLEYRDADNGAFTTGHDCFGRCLLFERNAY